MDDHEPVGLLRRRRALIVAYLLYMMIRKRKGERPGRAGSRAGALTSRTGGEGDGDELRQARLHDELPGRSSPRPLGGRRWAVLAGVPVGIIALYFLKLRRRPVQVPSTLLWRRSLEDLHVNSLFQRLRRNLLLFLQLLAVLLAMLALAGPRIKGTAGQGQRFVLMIDNSASMSATDVAPEPAGQGQGGGQEGRRRRWTPTTWRWSSPSPTGAGRLELHRRPRRAACADRRDRADPGDDLAPRGPPGRRRAGQPVEADRRGGRRLVGRHAQAVHLHRRRLRRRRGLQPGQPRARGRRDRPAARRPTRRRPRAAAPPTPRPRSATRPTTWRSSPSRPGATRRSPTSTRSSAASTTSAPRRSRPRPSSTATTADKPGDAGDAGRRDRAEAPPADRPVVQVRPARHRAWPSSRCG